MNVLYNMIMMKNRRRFLVYRWAVFLLLIGKTIIFRNKHKDQPRKIVVLAQRQKYNIKDRKRKKYGLCYKQRNASI